jgi:hypothetical protein
VSSTSNTLGDPSNCKFNGRKPQIYEVKSIAEPTSSQRENGMVARNCC